MQGLWRVPLPADAPSVGALANPFSASPTPFTTRTPASRAASDPAPMPTSIEAASTWFAVDTAPWVASSFSSTLNATTLALAIALAPTATCFTADASALLTCAGPFTSTVTADLTAWPKVASATPFAAPVTSSTAGALGPTSIPTMPYPSTTVSSSFASSAGHPRSHGLRRPLRILFVLGHVLLARRADCVRSQGSNCVRPGGTRSASAQ